MIYLVMIFVGMLGGALIVFLALVQRRVALGRQKREQEAQRKKIQEALEAATKTRKELQQQASQLKAREEEFDARFVSYKELQDENAMIKRDLQNIDVDLRKLQLDRDLQRKAQDTLDGRTKELGSRYLKENVKWIGKSLTPNNYVAKKQQLLKVIERCRRIDFDVSAEEEASLVADLKEEYEKIVRAAFEREEQARIRAQIREEQKLEKEIERELKQLERERAAIQVALEKALAEAEGKYSTEVENLRARLAEAEEKSQRAISRAQMTKSGHVYVISNIGSFGKGVFKIGMTRRLEPTDRVRELSSASVPFPFDVHMMVSCDDAPALENALHRQLHRDRVNKVNPRKEFYRSDIDMIRKTVEANHGEVQYVADPEALEYNQSLSISEEDSDFIEQVYDTLEEEESIADDE